MLSFFGYIQFILFILLLLLALIISISFNASISFNTSISHQKIGGKLSHFRKEKHNNFLDKFEQNVISAKHLLETKFKNMYSEEEQKIILLVSKNKQPLPNLWNDLKYVFQYREDKNAKMAHNLFHLHLGQRKLFMTEMQCLTRYLPNVNNSCIIVYAGAAEGFHLPLLFKLFPNTVWHLYDPSPFCSELVKMSKDQKQVYLYNEYFTDDVAQLWKHKCDIFICDIRLSKELRNEFEEQVAKDMSVQDNWTRIISPKMGTSLKFRLPYISSTIKQHIVKYIKGQILWQIWPPKNSTECRLIIDSVNNNEFMEIDVVKYQNACSCHNMIDRVWKTYELPCNDLEQVPGYDRCFDCTAEAMVWLNYNKLKNAVVKSVPLHMQSLTNIVHQQLDNKKSLHGKSNVFLPSAMRMEKYI